MCDLALATGWLPSQIENEDYGTLMRLVDKLKERTSGAAAAAKEAEFNRQLIAERKARGM